MNTTRTLLETLNYKLDLVNLKLDEILRREEYVMADLKKLEDQVKANADAEQSAVTLLTKLSDMLKAAATDPDKVNALADELKGSADRLAAAVVANTPADSGGGGTSPPAAPKGHSPKAGKK